MWRKTLNLFSWLALAAYLTASLAFTENRLARQEFKSVRVSIQDSADLHFVRAEDVTALLVAKGMQLHGLKMEELNRDLIRQTVLTIPGVKDVTVFSVPEGILNIDVVQRKPVLRYIGPKTSFYMDAEGKVVPLSRRYSARVLMITGDPDRNFLSDSLKLLVEYIAGQPFLDALIHGIHVYPDHTLELLTRVGDLQVFMGSAENYDWKLDKLRTFYQTGLPAAGWDQYSRIDLRYGNQVVGKKWTVEERARREALLAPADTAELMDDGRQMTDGKL